MPCPKCGHYLILEDGVEYCSECLHVTKRRGDPKYDDPEPRKKKPTGITPDRTIVDEVQHVEKVLPKAKKKLVRWKGKKCGCGQPVYTKGLCKRCYSREWDRNKKGINPEDYRGPYFASRLCTIPGCGRIHLAKGYCRLHYNKILCKQDWTRLAEQAERKCKLCRRLHYAKGLCKMHYGRVYDFEEKWKRALTGQ